MTEITRLQLPAASDEATEIGAQFRDVVALVERSNAALHGPGAASLSDDLALRMRRATDSEHVSTLVAHTEGVFVGVSDIFLPQRESTSTAETMMFVGPELDDDARHAVFEALVAASVEHSRTQARTTILGGGVATADGEIRAATGYGGVSPDDPESAAWLRRGAVLQQVYRNSTITLSRVHDLQAQLAEARARAKGFELRTWVGETPPQHRHDMCRLHERMSTEAPNGGLELDSQVWSDARLTEFEQHKMGGQRSLLTAAATHQETGALVGYTQMMVGSDHLARQHNLIVAQHHRGNRLGRLMKLAGLSLLQQEAPHATAVSTMNAEENRHMIRVNEEVGFLAHSWLAIWQLRCPAATMDA